MTTEATAPEGTTEAPVDPVVEEAPKPTAEERRASLIERMVKSGVTRPEPEAAPEPEVAASEEAPSEPAEEPATEEATTTEAEEPKAEEARTAEEKKDNARLAKALVDLEREQASRLRLEKKMKEFDAKFEAIKGKPEKALELADYDIDTFLAEVAQGKLGKPEEDTRTPEQKALEDLETRLKSYEEKEQAAEAAKVKNAELEHIRGVLKDTPIHEAFPVAAEQVHALYYQKYQETGDPPNMDEVVKTVVDAYTGDLQSALTSEKAARLALSDPKAREVILNILREDLGVAEKEKPARQENERATGGDGPSVITPQMASEVTERKATEKLTLEERKRRGVAILLNKL